MKIKPTNDLLFKKMMTTTGKEYILEDFIQAVTGIKLTNVRPTNPYQIESYQKEIENLNPVMYSTIEGENTDLSEWRDFLKNGTIKPESSRGLKEAQKIVNFSNLSGEERRLAALMEKYEDVYYQVMKHQLEEGIEIGEKQGIEQGIEIGRQQGVALGERKGQVMICFKLNLPMDEIQKYTGLSLEEIEAFKKELH